MDRTKYALNCPQFLMFFFVNLALAIFIHIFMNNKISKLVEIYNI